MQKKKQRKEAKLKEAAHARKMPQTSIMMTRAFARVSGTQKRTLLTVDITKQCKIIDSTNSRVDFFYIKTKAWKA